MLSEDYVPVALDVWYEERRQDEAGAFYRALVAQREGLREGHTTQGFYVARPDGHLLRGWNNRDPDKLARWLREHREASEPADDKTPAPAAAAEVDRRFARRLPDGAVVVDVFTRITAAEWPERDRGWMDDAMRTATGRDHLWITAEEIAALARREVPATLARRIARFHLVDDTRGEPPMWRADELLEVALAFEPVAGETAVPPTLVGHARLATGDAKRRCDAALRGQLAIDEDGHLARFDLVARCSFAGEGEFTPHAPPGTFTLVVAMGLAPANGLNQVPPQAARDLDEYLRAR